MFINWAKKEVNLKIVYYGPGLSGKTTNLECIHQQINPMHRGELIALKTREERTLYFDFLKVEFGQIKGMHPKFNLYTIPGQVYYAESRRLILKGVDGVVFVADSQPERMQENLESLLDLEQNLISEGKTLSDFPWVVQYNKRDLPNGMPVEQMRSKINFVGVPEVEAIASRNVGVIETLKTTIQRVIQRVHATI